MNASETVARAMAEFRVGDPERWREFSDTADHVARALARGPSAGNLAEIEARVRPTICPTFSPDTGTTVEGRISRDDFDALLRLLDGATARERERCAMLHESVNPSSDRERFDGDHGAGAMAAVLEYRDLIRQEPRS